MLKQYSQKESGIQFQQLSEPKPSTSLQKKSGVHFQLPPRNNVLFQLPQTQLQQHQQSAIIEVKPMVSQKNNVVGPLQKQKNCTTFHQTAKKHKHRGDKKRRVRYKTVEYKRQATGTSKLIFGSMFCWGMNAVTAYYLVAEATDSIMVEAKAAWVWFAAMATAFYVAGGFMHHVKRTAAAYCCWIATVVPVMLGCYCVMQFQNQKEMINQSELTSARPWVNLESLLLCLWFVYLTVLYISMGTVFYRYRSEGFTKVYN